jgi:hypothetical protein
MVRFFRVNSAQDPALWKELRQLWKHDAYRARHLAQVEEVRRGLILGQIQLWIAWDDDPPQRITWMAPQHLIGSVITFAGSGVLNVQFAGGRCLKQWMKPAAEALEEFAAEKGCERLDVYIRKGWLQELPAEWKSSEQIALKRDPELLRAFPEIRRTA